MFTLQQRISISLHIYLTCYLTQNGDSIATIDMWRHFNLSIGTFPVGFSVPHKGSHTLESFLSKVAFESNLRKTLARIEHVISKEEMWKFSWHTCKISFESYFRKQLSKENFLMCHYLKSEVVNTNRKLVQIQPHRVSDFWIKWRTAYE